MPEEGGGSRGSNTGRSFFAELYLQQLLHIPRGHLVAGRAGLEKQVYRMLEALGDVVGYSPELIVGEAHFWGSQVGQELLLL